jgi:UDP-galactopyranose mutase
VNYPSAPALTRITELKHITGDLSPRTTLMREYPGPYRSGENEPHYPIPSPAMAAVYQRYRREATGLEGQVWFAGRLGDYQYYNMDQACARGIALVEKELPGA